MTRLNAHVSFDGQCEAAFRCYEKALGGRIDMMMTYRESPMQMEVPEGWGEKIFHATFGWGAFVLTGGDVLPGQYQKPQGFMVLLHLETAAEAERAFHGLSEGAVVQVPLAETFWAARFGMLVDRFGVPWAINGGEGSAPAA